MNERCVGCSNNWCEVRQIHLNKIHFDRCQAGIGIERIDRLYATIAANREASKNKEIKIVIATEIQPKANHWDALHRYAVEHYTDWDEMAAKEFYDSWQSEIPNLRGCGCKEKWKKLGVVFDFSSPRAFFESAWAGHDTVSEMIGNPRFTLEECISIWGFPVVELR